MLEGFHFRERWRVTFGKSRDGAEGNRGFMDGLRDKIQGFPYSFSKEYQSIWTYRIEAGAPLKQWFKSILYLSIYIWNVIIAKVILPLQRKRALLVGHYGGFWDSLAHGNKGAK